eukprot:CAMPEP_0115024322 /NCGR_PEP_ID=MMETSP0216-20121206/33126_1 /TAXON_ID=223996 /ORGANISM="Protocruzia adherens, Strain Boccale" /LENGTH=530 /DNA_ID=CAMNT_0002398273 /DNA_START=28 /DNA_END=1620 /DNA_ORIENTATION=+
MPRSVTSDNASVRSNGSHRSQRSSYRKVANNSNVDESLFGNNKPGSRQVTSSGIRQNAGAGAATISLSEMNRIKNEISKGNQKGQEFAVLSDGDLKRIKASTRVVSKEQEFEHKKLIEEQKLQQVAAAKKRRDKIERIDHTRKPKDGISGLSKEERHKNNTLLANAQNMLDEELDDVKEMNTMVLYSKCVTIRDKQLEEARRIEDEKKEEEHRLDLMMEIERLKTIKYHEEREKRLAEERRERAQVIVEQIKEREVDRLRDQEMREKEKQQMLKHIEHLEHEEVEEAGKKKVAAAQLLQDINQANSIAILMKDKKKQEEREEEERILQYNLEKTQREQELQQEQERMRAEREKETQRLREMQERAQDRQAALDELRARRANEENERIAREKERKEAEHRETVNRELNIARKKQADEREKRLAEQAKQERDEFMRIIAKQKEDQDVEKQQGEERSRIRREHAEQLRAQIQLNGESKKQHARDSQEEGRKIREQEVAMKKKLETIKQKKLGTLGEVGIPQKYKAQLARKKVE